MRNLKTVLALGVCVLLAGGGMVLAEGGKAASPRHAGQHYKELPLPKAPRDKSGKVQVSEVFWYGCGHCYALDPMLEGWNAKKAPYIEFVRIPVMWGPPHWQHAKLFYTLQALRRPELHAAVFDAIHKEHKPLVDRDQSKAREMHFEFLSGHGVTREQFDAVYDSEPVMTQLRNAATFTENYRVANVPTIFVADRYSTSVSEAGSTDKLLALINHLAASEKNR
jgi:thiol:disulfide interchange protein DsbA